MAGYPNPWGFKIYTLCDFFGLIYNLEVHVSGHCDNLPGIANIGDVGNRVMKLCRFIPPDVNLQVYTDRFFTSMPLFIELLKKGIYLTGTVKLNKLYNINEVICSDKVLRNRGFRQ